MTTSDVPSAIGGGEEPSPGANEDTGRTTEGGAPVGAADRDADVRRGATGDQGSGGGMTDVDPDRATDGGVPVGRADAEADRRRAEEDA